MHGHSHSKYDIVQVYYFGLICSVFSKILLKHMAMLQ